MTGTLDGFAAEVGPAEPVTVVGGRTQWSVGGAPAEDVREVRAPAGIVAHEPAELTVRVRAGTTVAELDAALAEHGQMVPLDPPDPERATVGGVLAVGRSGIRRLGRGPVRDCLLEARYVSAEGRVVKAGGPTVKNVSGFDLCRLLVGSLGTLGLLAEVVVRVSPRPAASRWLQAAGADPFALRRRLLGASSILWDGATTWVLLEGHPADVDAESAVVTSVAGGAAAVAEVAGPPPLPAGGRLSARPSALRDLRTGDHAGFVAEVGVGVVHTTAPVPPPPLAGPRELHRRIKAVFDPTGRLNPGRSVVTA